jgi:hypothetical protein
VTLRKPVYFDNTDEFVDMDATDELELGGLTMSGDIAMGSNKVTGAAAATAAGDVLVYGQTGASLADLDLTGDLDMNSNTITNLATPTNDNDAANKAYVDAVAEGLDAKESVRAATTAAGTLASDFENGDVVDGVTLSTGDRVLIKNQGTGSENGIYVVQASGAPVRADDLDTGDTAASSYVFVEEGTTNADSGWLCINDQGSDVVGTDALNWTQFSGAGSITAGDGLGKTGNTIFVNAGNGIEIVTDNVSVDLSTTSGMQFNAGELEVVGGNGIEITGSGVEVDLSTTPGLQFNAGELEVLVSDGLEITGAGVAVDLATDPGLEFSGGDLTAKVNTAAALALDSNGINVVLEADGAIAFDGTNGGLEVQVDGTTVVINGSNQLEVIGTDEASRLENDYTAAVNLSIGDPVYFDGTNDQVGKSDAGGTAIQRRVIGVAAAAITASASGGIIHHGPAAGAISGLGATAGDTIYLDNGGGLSTTRPTGAGQRRVVIGYAINASDLFVNIQRFGVN